MSDTSLSSTPATLAGSTPSDPSLTEGLRAKVMRGGAYLTVRQGAGILLSVGGVLLLTRLIGPANYGLYAAGLATFTFLAQLSQWGVEVYLLRQEEVLVDAYHLGHTLLMTLAGVGILVGSAVLPLLSRWVSIPGYHGVTQTMLFMLPVVGAAQIPLAKLERSLDYRPVAMIELAGQATYYAFALSLGAAGRGAWAPVSGWLAMHLFQLVAFYTAAHYRPRLRWDRDRIREMITYGLGYSASMWVLLLRTLVNPLIVGRYGGAASVGYVALAIRLVDTIGFIRGATWRLAMAALAKLRQPARLLAAVNEAMPLQLLAVGPLLVGFALLAPAILPSTFGTKWLPVLSVFPYIALGSLFGAMFGLHSSVLYLLKRKWEVAIFNALHAGAFAIAAFVLVPPFGIRGYGMAEIVAILPYTVIDVFLRRAIGRPNYALPALWTLALGLGLFTTELGPIALSGIVVALLVPMTWMALTKYAQTARAMLRTR